MSKQNNINIRNKKAYFDYEIIEKYVAGVQLSGTEIKSLRLGKASLVEAYCYFVKNELWIKGFNIAEYFFGTYNNHMPLREGNFCCTKKNFRNWIEKLRNRALRLFR